MNIAALLNIRIDNPVQIDISAIESMYQLAPISRQEWIDSIIEGAGFKTGFFQMLYEYLLANGLAPLIILLGVGVMTDLSYLYKT